MNPIHEELESLLFDWEAGTLDEAGIQRLRQILKSSSQARTYYANYQMLSVALKLEGDSHLLDIPISDSNTNIKAVPKRFSFGSRMALVAAALILSLAGRVLYLEFSTVSTPTKNTVKSEATSSGIALVTRLVDIKWAADQTPLEIGDALEPGRLAIDAGYAQVEFFCGATVVLEGPAVLDLKTSTLARVLNGRLTAQVPPAARGFSLEFDDMKVVDLGTEFGLAVTPEASNVQVFDGEVELHHRDQTQQLLTAGQGIQRNSNGHMTPSNTTPTDFVDIAALESRASSQQAGRFKRWNDWSTKLRADPRLITYYAFNGSEDWTRKLPNNLQPVNSELDGAIVGAQRVAGRWPNKSALEFKRPGDRVRVQIPGEYRSLTFACWVKIDSLDRWYNSLFLTDGYEQGEPHWQILDSGQLFFSVRVSAVDGGQKHRKVLSPPFWNPKLSGKWLHLATTFDVDSKQVCHYLNGQQIHEETIPDHQLVSTTRFGMSTIGNWTAPQRPDEDFAIRNLNGRMDEFALFSEALAADEIQQQYENGKP